MPLQPSTRNHKISILLSLILLPFRAFAQEPTQQVSGPQGTQDQSFMPFVPSKEIERLKKCGQQFSGMEAAVLYFERSEARKNLSGYWVTREVFVLTPAIMGCIAFAEANRLSATVPDHFLTKLNDGQLRTIVMIYAAPEKFAPENPAFRIQCGKQTVLPVWQKELDDTSVALWRAGYKTDSSTVTDSHFLDYLTRTFIRLRGSDATHLRVWQVNFAKADTDLVSVLDYQIVDDSGKITAKEFDRNKLEKVIDILEKPAKNH